MPTGTGKTRAFCELARLWEGRSLIVVHRDELVQQTVATLAEVAPGTPVGVLKGKSNDWQAPKICVATVQSLHNRRLKEIPPESFGLVVLDEAHHAAAPTWRAVWTYLRPRFLLGCTATPERLDGKGLVEAFGPEPLFVYPLPQAIDDGVLVPIRQYAVRTNISLDGVRVRAGDFAPGELARVVRDAARTQAIVQAYQKHGGCRKAITFCADLAHVQQMVEGFQDAGIRAEGVTGRMGLDRRRRILARFKAGKFRVLVGCELLTEGFDDPGISCVLMARPTKSGMLYRQCIGRGLRLCPEAGKADCLVLDVVDNCRRHSLVTAPSLFGAEAVDADGQDIREVVRREKEQQEAERARREAGDVSVSIRLEEVDPFRPTGPNLEGYHPTEPWHNHPATDKQKGVLYRRQIPVPGWLTKGQASWLMDQATPKQKKYLKWQRAWEEGMTFKEASKRIALIKNWAKYLG
jgi:superfamily II DNA or RNA helicase